MAMVTAQLFLRASASAAAAMALTSASSRKDLVFMMSSGCVKTRQHNGHAGKSAEEGREHPAYGLSDTLLLQPPRMRPTAALQQPKELRPWTTASPPSTLPPATARHCRRPIA